MSRFATAREVTFFLRQLRSSARLHHATVADVHAAKTRALQKVLEAASRTRLYGRSLSRAAVREGRLDAVEPVDKETFQGRLEDTFADPAAARTLNRARITEWVRDPARAGQFLDGRYLVAMTSGTTGQVGLFVNDIESWGRMRGLTFARMFRGRMSAGDFGRLVEIGQYKMTFIVGVGGHYMTSLLAQRVPKAGKLVLDSTTLSIEMPIPAIVARLNEIRPHLLHSYATVLELLAAEKLAGRLQSAPDVITSGSEPLTASARTALNRAFPNAQLIETYGATECVALATADEEGEMLINEDACVLEAVDDNLRPVPAGETGTKVLVTNLLNRAQPLVRYVLTDQVRIDPRAARDGSPFARIRVHGRTDDMFFLQADDDSWQAHPPIPFEILFLNIGGLLQYQLVHEQQNRLRIVFVPEAGVAARDVEHGLGREVKRYLDEHKCGKAVTFELEARDALQREANGRKIRQIRSDVARPSNEITTGAQLIRERRRRPHQLYTGPERRRQ